MRRTSKIALLGIIGGVVITATVMAQQSQTLPWSQCCGMSQWPMIELGMLGHRMMGWGIMERGGRMMARIPARYNSMSNSLPRTRETVERGAAVYERNCSSCHGATGAGDGPMGLRLSPRPANLQWLSQMPIVQRDAFMYWTIAEGGAHYGNAMPAFKDTLSRDDIWAVIGYIQARLPKEAAKQNQQ